MIGYVAIEAETTKPAIGQIEMDFLAHAPLGADAKAITDDQHPDHQFGIDRGATHRAVEVASSRLNSPSSTNLSMDRKRWSAGTCLSRENSQNKAACSTCRCPIMILSPACRRD